MSRSLLIANVHLCDATGMSERLAWVLCRDGVIDAIGTDSAPEADCRIDGHGATLTPGFIDSHVHFRQPGLEAKGTIAGESRAALAGGITTVFDMPNTRPATTTATALAEKLAYGRRESAVRYYAFFGAVPGCMKELRSVDPAIIPGVKVFLGTSTGAMQAPSTAELADLMKWCRDNELPVMVHAEDDAIIAANARATTLRYGAPDLVPLSEHSLIRSAEACYAASERAADMAVRYGARLHLAHVSTARELSLLSPGDPSGKLITAETTPMYLDPVIANPANRTGRHKINPAVKTEADAEALRAAVADGRIDTLATDHAPHEPAAKQGSALTAASGAPSVQFAVAMMLQYLPLELIVKRMAWAPGRIFGHVIPSDHGILRPGMPADLALIKRCEPYAITDGDVLSACGWTPFAGRIVSHRIAATVGGEDGLDRRWSALPLD